MKLKKRYIIVLLLIILISLGSFIYIKIHNKNSISYITTKQKKLGSANVSKNSTYGNYRLLDDSNALILTYGDYTVKVVDSEMLNGDGYKSYMGFEFFFCRPKKESDGGCDSWNLNGDNGIYERLGQTKGDDILRKVKGLYEKKYKEAKAANNYYLANYWVKAYNEELVQGRIDSKIINEVAEPVESNRCDSDPFNLGNSRIIWQDNTDPKFCIGYFDSPDYLTTIKDGYGATYEDFRNAMNAKDPSKMKLACNIIKERTLNHKTSGTTGSYKSICEGVDGYENLKLDYYLRFSDGYWTITIKDTPEYGISYEEFFNRYGGSGLVNLRQLLINDMMSYGNFNYGSILEFNNLEYNQNNPANQIPIKTECSAEKKEGYAEFSIKYGYEPNPSTFTESKYKNVAEMVGSCGCEFVKDKLEQYGALDQFEAYNQACTSEQLSVSTITLDWQGGWGPNTLGVNWDGNNGIYKITGVVGTSHNVVFDQTLHYFNYNLIGWSTTRDCATKIGSGGLTHNFTFGTSNVTYFACYDGDVYEGSLFDASGNKKTGNSKSTYENKKCDISKTTTGNLTNVPQKRLNRYTKQTYQTIDSISTAGNEYCNVLCTDTIDVKYPNIFETIPAGQYFELLYEPEIFASRTCQAQLKNSWNSDYQNAINEEVNALNAYEEAKAQYDATVALSPQRSSSKNCDPYQCGTIEHPQTCYRSYTYSDTKSASFQDAWNGSNATKTASFSACNSTDTTSLVNSAETEMNSKKALYETAVNKRVKLEKDNLQCYTLLDSDKSNVSTKSKEVFNNNYTLLNNLDPSYKTEAEKIVVSEDVATSDVYKNYITSNTSITNDALTSFSGNAINTKNFFYMYPEINVSYDPGNIGKPSTNESDYIKDTLLAEAHVKLDTGSYTTIDDSGYKKDAITSLSRITKEFWVRGVRGTYIDFPYYSTETRRQVKYYFTYHEGTEFYSSYQNGAYSKVNASNKVSLSKKTKYKVGETGSEIEVSNNVYPVSIKATTNKYNISFKLGDKSGTNYLRNNFSSESTFEYTCDYEITNDVLVSLGGNYEDLKNNTIFRSVALGTDSSGSTLGKLDPNNRASSSNFGENWLNPKGQAVAKEINEKENTATSSKNTYNPENLEYSFTLTPSLIAAIKEYNEDNPYDDYNLVCNTEDGRECVSKFLENLAKGQVKNGGTDYCIGKNCRQVNTKSEDLLNKSRKNWKYYVCDDRTKKCGIENKNTLSLEDYTKFYSKWGVLQ